LGELVDPFQTSISIITPPKVTLGIMNKVVQLGIPHVWLQPGSESAEAVKFGQDNGVNVIYGGPCILVTGKHSLDQSKL
jgi:predicted CoA-binding protein